MASFKCNGCGSKRELTKTTTVYRDGEWVVKEAKCSCEEGKYMEQIFDKSYEGLPNLKRTEESLTKKK